MDFTRKARFFVNGPTTPITPAKMYAGVVYREAVRIAFTYAELNGIDIMEYDIQNDYLYAPISDRYWNILGPEFGPELKGCKDYVVRALYGTHCAGSDLRQHLRKYMEILGYTLCLADPYL